MRADEVYEFTVQDMPVTVVVFNNGQWGAEKRNQMDFYGERYTATLLDNPDFARVASAMGAHGIRVEAVDQIGDALRFGLASDKVTVVDIPLTRELAEPYRRDALRKPVRKLAKYKALSLAEVPGGELKPRIREPSSISGRNPVPSESRSGGMAAIRSAAAR